MRAAALLLFSLLTSSVVAAPSMLWTTGVIEAGSSSTYPLNLTLSHTPLPNFTPTDLRPQPFFLWPVTLGLGKTPATLTLTPQMPHSQGSVMTVPLTLRPNIVAAGVYALSGASSTLLPSPLAINPQVASVSPTHPGQRYLRTSAGGHYTHNGADVSFAFLTSHILTLTKLEDQRAVFYVDGVGEIIRQGTPQAGFPELAPLVADSALEQLRHRYVGQPIWAYGGLFGFCHPTATDTVSFEAPFRTALHIRDVVRVAKPTLLNVNGNEGDEDSPGADVIALTPLIVLITASPDIKVGSSYTSSSSSVNLPFSPVEFFKHLHPASDACGDTYALLLPDTWALERVFSRTPPRKGLPDVMPQDFRTLTRLDYAWLNGLPTATYGTLKELLAQPTWAYRNSPSADTVTFSKDGLVQKIDESSLP